MMIKEILRAREDESPEGDSTTDRLILETHFTPAEVMRLCWEVVGEESREQQQILHYK